MSGFSSFKNSKLLFENWQTHVTEISDPIADTLAYMNAQDLLEVLSRMPEEGDLPSWWMSKATLASNYLSKMRDYLVYPSEKQLKLPLEEKDDPVSKEISKLVDKGTPHKQAVAIALDMEEKGKI